MLLLDKMYVALNKWLHRGFLVFGVLNTVLSAPDPCKVDICVAMDRHPSITTSYWTSMLEHVALSVPYYHMEITDTRIGVVTFDEISSLDIPLNEYDTTDQLQADIRAMPHGGVGRDISGALVRMRVDCFTEPNGDRSDVPNYAILITNGASDPTAAEREASLLREAGATILCIGVGPDINYTLLVSIADAEEGVFTVPDFLALQNDPTITVNVICPGTYCDHSIKVQGIDSTNGNHLANGEYTKVNIPQCNNRDVFRHTTNAIFLRHYVDDTIGGIWVFSDIRNCANEDPANQYVRSPNENEFNPGLISVWQEQVSTDIWETKPSIIGYCYGNPNCTYEISGVTNVAINGYYHRVHNTECEFRDVHKHESQDIYLYFIKSINYDKYYWVVYNYSCIDSVYNGAFIQHDDYSVSPELSVGNWEERNAGGTYQENSAVVVQCHGYSVEEPPLVTQPPAQTTVELTTQSPTITTELPPVPIPITPPGGSVYTRWGRLVCDGDATLLYDGIMGGSSYLYSGSGSNYLCLDKDPEWANYMEGNEANTTGRAVIYGVEYHGNPDEIFSNTNLVGGSFMNQNIPCAMCDLSNRSSVFMAAGTKSCPTDWTLEYWGYLSANHFDSDARSEYVCIDHAPEVADGGGQQQIRTARLYHVETRCGAIICPPYIDYWELTCAVCSK